MVFEFKTKYIIFTKIVATEVFHYRIQILFQSRILNEGIKSNMG
jgi:hypothetical protein